MTRDPSVVSQIDSRWADWGSDHELTLVWPRPGAGYVYVAWGADETRPLYIGKAVNPGERILNHIREKPWAKDVLRWEVHGFPNAGLAELVEIEAIYALNPIYNVLRRLTQAQWDEHYRLLAEREAGKEEARSRAFLARVAAREARQAAKRKYRIPSERAISPHPRKRLRHITWRDDIFTPDQMAIIARVQNRGRAA